MSQEAAVSKSFAVLQALSEGPMTTAEVAAETGFSKHNACSHLFNLFALGKIEKKPFFKDGIGRRFWLWSIRWK